MLTLYCMCVIKYKISLLYSICIDISLYIMSFSRVIRWSLSVSSVNEEGRTQVVWARQENERSDNGKNNKAKVSVI